MSISFSKPPVRDARRMPSQLVDHKGQPMSYWLYKSPRENWKQYRPRYYLSSDTKVNVSPYDRWEMVNYARQLFAQIPEIGGSVRQKNQWAFGEAWDAHYAGKNEAWGDEAKEWLDNAFFPNCNLRGQPFNFKKSLYLSGMSMDYDGDDAMLLTEFENHFPAVAFLPAPKISSQVSAFGYQGVTVQQRGEPSGDIVQGGAFDGARMFDGIIMDRNNRMIAIRIQNEDGTFADIPASSADLRYDPEWHDQGRGIPLLGRPLLQGMDYQDIREFLKRALKRASKFGVTMKSREGDAIAAGLAPVSLTTTPIGNPGTDAAGQPVTQKTLHIEELDESDITYLSTDEGEAVESIKFDQPNQNVNEFVKDHLRSILHAIGWPLELYYLADSGRAPTRIVCKLGNASISGRQSTLYPRWKRAVIYAVAKAMKHGFISKNDDFKDWSKWEPGFPADLSVDDGNDEAAMREGLKMGLTSKQIIAQHNGYHHHEIRRQRNQEIGQNIEDAIAAMAFAKGKGVELQFDRAMELIEQRSPNPTATATGPDDAGDGPEAPTKK